jgi:hypothetical protein
MKRSNRFGLALALGLSLMAAVSPFELQLKEKDHKKIGESLTTYFEAVSEKSGIAKAKSGLKTVLEKVNKSLSKKAKEDVDVLSLTDDITASFLWAGIPEGRATVGKVKEFTFDSPFGPIECAIHAPKKYKASKGPVPLILTIPEEGQKLGEHLNEDWMLGDLRDGAVIAALQMPKNVDLWSKSSMDPIGGLETIMFGFREIRQMYSIDPDRIFIAGRGDGVGAAANVASIFPYIFAGLIGRAGDLGETSPKNFGNVHAYFTGGGSNVSTFCDQAVELGYETVTNEPEGKLESVWEWVSTHSRIANPTKVDFELKSPYAAQSYWISAEGFDPEEEPIISGEIDREKNVIVITASNVSSVTLFFNDSLVDLDREVTVLCNGVEQKDTFSRSLTTALNQFYNSNDAGRIYTAFKSYDLPKLEEE